MIKNDYLAIFWNDYNVGIYKILDIMVRSKTWYLKCSENKTLISTKKGEIITKFQLKTTKKVLLRVFPSHEIWE